MTDRRFEVGDVVLRTGTAAPRMEVKQIGKAMPGAPQTLVCEWWTDGILRTDILSCEEVELPNAPLAPLL